MNRIKLIQLLGIASIAAILSACTSTKTPIASEPQSWKFAVFCDTRGDDQDTPGKACVNTGIVRKIADDIVAEGCELVVVPGDLANGWWAHGGMNYDHEFKSWKEAMAPVYQKGINVYTVRGNHESGPGAQYPPVPPYDIQPDEKLKQSFLQAFNADTPQDGPDDEKGLTYSFTHKNALFVGFDAYVNPNRLNQTWLDEVLKTRSPAQTPHLFTYSHCPAYQVVHPDCLAYYTEQRDTFWNTIAANGGRLYFCGHDHMYNRASVTAANGVNVYQALVGSCGAPFKTWPGTYAEKNVKPCYNNDTNYGYMVVTVTGIETTSEWKALSADGALPWAVKDKFSCSVAEPAR